MDLKLHGKTALVLAGSRGFGKAVALGLAAEGAAVAVCARGEGELRTAAAEIQDAGGKDARVLALAADIADPGAMADLTAQVEQELGPVDLLLLNGGGPPAGSFGELDLEQWEAAYRLLVESSVSTCRLLMPGMMARGWGRIIQITSISVFQPVENLVLSNVLRPAVHSLIRNLALEAAPSGVTVNSVAPGFHMTSAVERLITRKIEQTGCTREDVLAGWTGEIPLGRLGKPEELASLVLYLMSEGAAYITGQNLVCDGGWVRGTF